MSRTRVTSAILNLSPSCFQRVQIFFFTFKKPNFSPQIHLTHFEKPDFVILILRKSLKPNKKSYLTSGASMSVSVEIVVDDVAVIARSVVAALVVVAPSSQGISPQMKKHSIPMSKTFQKISRKQAELKREVAATKINNRLTQNAI